MAQLLINWDHGKNTYDSKSAKRSNYSGVIYMKIYPK